ncbi:MAG: glycosyltransferase family 2 protein [Clostridia bacterium]|nr:glycosyltransferase family 2 protein [Clostridia bacterium]
MNNIKLSIIVPIYNKEKYLVDCLDTIINQTLKEIEIILVDDGSTDNSKTICETYLSDPRISYYYQKNEGLASARQTGINASKGEYLGFIDADDWIELDMFEKMYQKAKEYNADVVYCNRRDNVDDYRPPKDIPTGFYNREQIVSEILPKSLAYIGKDGWKRVISWSNCRRIYRKQLLESFNFSFDKRFRRSQDLQLTYEAMLHAKSFYHMGDDYFYHTRTVGDSLSRGYNHNIWSYYVPLIERLYKDTEDFKEIDLMPNMHLRAFAFVVDCIENERNTLCPNNREKSIEIISEIINDPLCKRFYGQLPLKELNAFYRKYYKLVRKKKAAKIFDYMPIYGEKLIKRKKIISKIMYFLTESAVIGRIYKKIRRK